MSGTSGAGAPPPTGIVCNSVLSFVASAQPTVQPENLPTEALSESGEGSQADRVPAGIKAICDACTKLYPDQPNPLQVTTRLKYWLGGEDPLDYISMYWNAGKPEDNVPPHWHYITFGVSDLHGDGRVHTRGPVSGFGFELSFRLAADSKTPPLWPSALCQALARYIFTTGNKLCPGDHISWHRPLDNGKSRIRHLLVARDSQIKHVHSPYGELQLLQIVGCTSRELKAAQRGSGFEVLKKMADDPSVGPWLVTRMARRVSVGVSVRGLPTLAGVSHAVWWTGTTPNAESEQTSPNISANEEQQIKDTLQRGLSTMSAESVPAGVNKMSTDSFEMSSIERALPDISGSIQTSWRGTSSVQYLDAVHIFMNAEGASLLPLAIDGRVRRGSHFTWRGPLAAVTFTAPSVSGILTTDDKPIAATDTWLQVQLAPEEAKELSALVGGLGALCDSDSESEGSAPSAPPPALPHTLAAPRTPLTITVLHT